MNPKTCIIYVQYLFQYSNFYLFESIKKYIEFNKTQYSDSGEDIAEETNVKY